MKKFNFKWLLLSFILSIASINTAWAGTYTVVGVAMENSSNYYPRISINVGGSGDGCASPGWWNWLLDENKAGITFEGRKLYLAQWTDCWNGTDDFYFQQISKKDNTGANEVNNNHVHASYTSASSYHKKIWQYNESNSSGGSWYSSLTMTTSKVYFDATGWSETDIDLCIAHMNYQAFYDMAHVAHTKLYYTNASYSWDDAMGFGVVGGYSRADEQSATGAYWITDISDNAAEYTGFKHTALNNNDANHAYLCVNAGKTGQQPTVSSNSSYATLLNSTQTIKSYVSEDYGSSYDNADSKATITITSFAMTSQGASGATASNGSLSTSAKSTTVTSARTATTTLSVGTVADGYVFVGWYDGSGNALPDDGDGDLYTYTYYPTGATEVRAYFKNEVSHPVTISNYCTTNSTTISSTSRSIGESTPVPITAPGIDDHTFVNWTLGNGMTNHSANENANPISVTTDGAGSTYTLRANYTLVPCTLWYHTSSATFADKTGQIIMSYDLEEDAYYADVASTPSSPYYFRFYHNGATQYSAAWDGSSPNVQSAVPNGSKITCDQNVNSWGTKSSIKYVGNSGTAIRIWFDYKNKEAWITADKDKQYVLRGSTYADTKVAEGMPGWDATTTYFNGLASGNTGTVTATLSAYTKYCLKVYDRYSDTWYGYSTNNTEYELINNTLATTGTGTNNNFYFTTTAAGTYTFTVDKSSVLKVKVNYPTAYTVTYYNKFRDIDGTITEATTGGSISGMSGSASGARTSGQYFNNIETVTLTHSTANGGYSWIGWYNSEACSTAYEDGTNVDVDDEDRTLELSNLAANTKVAALYAEVGTTVTLANDGHGHVEIGGATVTSTTVGKTTSRTIVAVNSTGYHFNAWTATSGTDYTIGNTGNASTTLTGKGSGSSSQTVTATFTANSYSVRFNRNGGTGGDDMDNQAFTYDAAQNLTTCSFSKIGYDFAGWATSDDGDVAYTDEKNVSNLSSTQSAVVDLYAIWTPIDYTITLDVDETNKGTFTGATGSVTATYDATLSSIGGTLPVAANGYRYMGMYTAANGGGVALTDSLNNWLSDVTDYISSGKWVHVGDVELYAYYKQAEITGITFTDGAVVAPSTSKTVTVVLNPQPTGTTTVCWRVLYSNDNPLDPQPEFSSVSGNSVSFTAPATSGMYKMEAVLHLGSGCGGEELSTYVANFQVAGDHTVTVQYKDASNNVIAPSGSVTGKPLEWTEVVAHEIFGYTYSGMTAGDGVTLRDTTPARLAELQAEDPTIVGVKRMKAVYDGKLTINYTQNQMIYFKNTLGWENVYVNFHTGNAWNNTDNGSGSPKGVGNSSLSTTNRNNHMIQIGESDVYYYDYGAASIEPSLYISFTDQSRDGVNEFWGDNPGINVVYPANYADALSTDKSSENGFKAATPMFVPLSGVDPAAANVSPGGKANYYNRGYWTTYTAGTGYTLEIYYDDDASSCIQSIPFTSADDLMPMSAVVDLEAGTTYRYQVRRGGTESNGIYYGNTNTMTYANHGVGTGWIMENTMAGGFKKAKITTNASGNYTFNLSYSPNASNEYRLRMEVDYPIADGDYRLIYTDATRDSGTRYKPSAIVTKANNSKDTVSFFVRPGLTPVLKIQQATVTGAGAITWGDLSDISSSVSSLSKDSVYNICLTMNGSGVISVENVEAYTGNFYIRTNAAGASKWDNYRSSDHLMTYSEYSATNADYSHYFMAYVGNGTNVKFVVANDYSPCISDTVKVQTYRGGDDSHVTGEGDIQADANVRFMWNRHNNGAYRAYLAAAKSDGSKFLVLRANSNTDLMDENGNALINSANSGEAGYNHKAPDNSMQFIDDENWIYETTVKIKPGAFLKLYANFHNADFYYKGENNSTFDKDNAIQLLGGSGDAEKIRVIYDFKTDRLVSAWMPTGDIDEVKEIYADVMFVREHQGDIEQLTFSKGEGETMGAITKIETAYGVLRFNKWTINNKSKADGHAVLDPGASRYERDLFYVSFPFRVAMNEVFGFGTYGKHWIIEYYDGAARAEKGFWADTPTYWRFVTDRKGKFFEPDQGYIIALDLDEMGESSEVWDNGVENVELYFPSYGEMGDITNATVVQNLPAHTCAIGPRFEGGDDRRIADSHWNVMSVPTYVNTSNVEFSNTTWTAERPSFLYEWNMGDNSLTPRSGSGYTYHAMHAYIVQYAGDVTWTSTSVTPSSIVARRAYAEAPSEVEFRLELSQNEKMADQTFVKLSNDEEVSAEFVFGEDMSKEFNKNKANIYTMVSTMIDGDLSITKTAGNTLPMSEQMTVIPVGVKIAADGDYTFAIPEGTEGIGVTLVDNETGIRTSLSALDYTISLSAGTYDNRFILEISPVRPISTDLEAVTGDGLQVTGARKIMIDGILYIVKDGKMFDARGNRVN